MADNSVWQNLTGAAAQGASQVVVDAARNKRQFKYQTQAMDKQQQLNQEAWNLQNQYNTPQMQMERLLDAGLNPRLIYGSGSSAPNMSGPLSVAQAPVREATGAKVPGLSDYYSIRQADAQYKQTTMATDIMQKTAGLKDIETALKNLQLVKENQRAPNYQAMAILETDLKHFAAQRARALFENEGRKGMLMDQLGDMRQKQMTSVDLDNAFKAHRNELSKLGIYTTDHPAFRVLIQAAKRMNVDLGELLMRGAKELKYLLDLKPGQ